MSSDSTSELSGELSTDLTIEVRTQFPVEMPIESRTKVWSYLSIDLPRDVPVEWSNEMPTEWRVELWVEVPSKVTTELPSELPSPEWSAGLGSESRRERVGELMAAVGRSSGELPGLKQRRNRREAASGESKRIPESVNRGRYLSQPTGAHR